MEIYDKAVELLEIALNIDLSVFGEAHPKVAIRRSNLADVLDKLGEYERAIELFNKALAQTQYIHKDLIAGDGIRYYFFNNFESGTTWSPKQGTRMEQLVNICNDLIKFANSNEIDLAFDLKKRIKRLIRKIN